MGPNSKKQSGGKSVPKEVQQYYASEHRDKVGLAWLIAFVSLIITVGVVLGIFFGGRWVYRKAVHNNNAPVATKPVSKESDKSQSSNSSSSTPSTSSSSQSDNNSSTPSTPSAPTASPSTPSQPSGSSPSSSSSTPTSGSSPSSQSQPQNLTNTGPSQIIATFIAASTFGTIASQVYLRRKAAKIQSVL